MAKLKGTFTAILHKEGEFYVAQYPEIGTTSQGASLREVTEIYLEEIRPIRDRSHVVNDL